MKSNLKEYAKKRDFTKTKEPKGRVSKKKSKAIFVVQEHHARRLHYDFRLELDGVLKSWAVPKGPSIDPKDKRLAVQTEDHPLEYAKFHGSIPEGEYGAGEVFIWDHGTWESEVDDPQKALEKGELKFRLKGKRLNGSFVLVRTHFRGDSHKNWLLIKHKDEKVLSPKKVSKKKKIKVKRGEDEWPGFIAPQLPRLVTEVPQDERWLYEMKFDGYRIEGHIQNGIGHLFTRNALDWGRSFPHILNALEKIEAYDAIFDGEIVAFDSEGRTNFQRLQNSIKSKDDTHLRYYIFDLLYLNGVDLRALPLIERKEKLKKLLKGSPDYLQYCEHIMDEGESFYEVSCEHKLEGVISKMADAPYTSGRNDFWVKIKCTQRQEFVIGGWTEPQGGRTGLGALLLGIYENHELKYVGKVGTGFNQETLRSLRKEIGKYEMRHSPFDLKSPKGKSIHWVKPELVCEVNFSNWTDDGHLRTPVFLGMREDKRAEDIGRETPQETASAEISSPDKIIFSKDQKTKQDVANYYKKVAPVMLPYMENRPLSLVRCPSGSKGKCFFQKHFTGKTPLSFKSLQVKEGKGEGTYITIDSDDGLLDLAQLNAYEIHAWNCDRHDIMRPNQIVMDLDPGPGVEWSQVVDGAIELKNLLLDLELDSFVKVTGGKGLHLHIPVAPIYDWEQIKSFAQSLALEMVSRFPDLYTANMSKNVRKKKIFIDYLRNGYGATAVVPYSLRAKDQSVVALPVEWKELKKIKGADEFTMDKALKKIKMRARDPWDGILDLHQEINILRPVKSSRTKKAA